MKSQGKPRAGLVLISFISLAVIALGAGVIAALTNSGDVRPVHSSANLGAALIAEGKTAEARKYFEEALKKNPKNIEALRGLAQCAIDDGDDELAIGYLRQLTTLASQDRSAWRKLALCLSRLGRDMEAMTAAQTALSLAPEGDRGMSDLVSRLVGKKSMLEGEMAGDRMPGDALPGGGRKGTGIDPASGFRPPEAPDPRKNLPSQGRDR